MITEEIDIDKIVEEDKHLQFAVNGTQLMEGYYKDYFPFESVFNWLSYSTKSKINSNEKNSDYFSRREISYIIYAKNSKDEICMRNLCYLNMQEFRTAVLRFNPARIDIGPVCDKQPSKGKDLSLEIKPIAIEREYVIDIDMTDYDSIRTCCSGKKMCHRCWQFMVSAYKVLKVALEEDFGFRHILWVFSGRRGMHAWVCDERARIMENFVRKSMTNYLNVSVSNEKSDSFVKPQVTKKMDYLLFKRSYEILSKDFKKLVIEDQEYLKIQKNAERVLNIFFGTMKKNKIPSDFLLNNKPINEEGIGHTFLKENLSSIERWEIINSVSNKSKESFDHAMNQFKYEIVLGLLYPKIDSHVSAQTNHLLKCPFNIHAGTGNVSVPIKNVLEFDYNSVPTVSEIVSKSRSMDEYIEVFESFIKKIQTDEIIPKESIERQQRIEHDKTF